MSPTPRLFSRRPRRPTRRWRWFVAAGAETRHRRIVLSGTAVTSSNQQVRGVKTLGKIPPLFRNFSFALFRPLFYKAKVYMSITVCFTGQEIRERCDGNPFSFKAFLKNGTQTTNYHNTGARPKVYYTPASSPGSHEAKETGVYSSRNPTELPDFVQDHLVIEQCYLNHAEPDHTQQVLLDMDNLPDFALNSMEQRQSRLRNESGKRDNNSVLCDMSFDLTGMLDKSLPHRDHSNTMHSNHLGLPIFERYPIGTPVHRPGPTGTCTLGGARLKCNHFFFKGSRQLLSAFVDFPFDLPLPLPNESNPDVNATTRDGPSGGGETSVHKSLPDFLSDGPIHNRTTDPEPNPSMAESTERRVGLF